MTVQLMTSAPCYLEGERDAEGHRTYQVRWKVETTAGEGPAAAMQCAGLPLPGRLYLINQDVDIWAFCTLKTTVKPHGVEDELPKYWIVEQEFTTRPPKGTDGTASGGAGSCRDQQITDPLLEPQKMSGSFLKFTEEAAFDRFGNRILTSSWEPIRGPQVEFESSFHQIVIEQNVIDLQLAMCDAMKDCVNATPLWGASPRMVRLANFDWEMKTHGLCYKYFTRRFTFEVNVLGFDRDVLDEGKKCLRGRWDTDPTSGTYRQYTVDSGMNHYNPSHFDKFIDFNGNVSDVILDGAGKPYNPSGNVGAISATPANTSGVEDYQLGGIVTLVGGTSTAPAKFQIRKMKPTAGNWFVADVPQFLSLYDSGSYSSPPTNPVSTTVDEAGTGLKLNVQWGHLGVSNPGTIHVEKHREADFFLLRLPARLG